MAENNRHFDVLGLILVLLGLAYAGFAIYWGANTEWSPHTDYYVQQILNHNGKYIATFETQAGSVGIVDLKGRYAYVKVDSDGLINAAYLLPEMNLVGVARKDSYTYLLSVSGKHASIFRIGSAGMDRFDYNLDLWTLRSTSRVQISDSPVFYVPGTWRNHYGVLRLDFSEINNPVARVFYDVPTSDFIRDGDSIYFQSPQGRLHELAIRGKTATDYRILITGSPLSARDGIVAVQSEKGVGYVEINGNTANAIILDGTKGNAVVTDFGTFISDNGKFYAVTGHDKNSLRVLVADFPFEPYSYIQGTAEYEILGTYAADPAYIHGTFDFPHCPQNFVAIDANVTFITAPVERVSSVRGVLTPINYEGNTSVALTPAKLSVDFPCYSP